MRAVSRLTNVTVLFVSIRRWRHYSVVCLKCALCRDQQTFTGMCRFTTHSPMVKFMNRAMYYKLDPFVNSTCVINVAYCVRELHY